MTANLGKIYRNQRKCLINVKFTQTIFYTIIESGLQFGTDAKNLRIFLFSH